MDAAGAARVFVEKHHVEVRSRRQHVLLAIDIADMVAVEMDARLVRGDAPEGGGRS